MQEAIESSAHGIKDLSERGEMERGSTDPLVKNAVLAVSVNCKAHNTQQVRALCQGGQCRSFL